jgi:8-oxo-dGTP pyrophosphatase MutT (NUDIX family)
MEPDTWGTIGGRVEAGETPDEAAVREFREETRSRARIAILPLLVFRDCKAGFAYHNHLGVVPREFKPRRNWETSQWAWLTLHELLDLEPKHFGLAALLADTRSLRVLSGDA